eukprot:1159545-Pelagomonas_calceolata.AAC.9
MAHRGKFVHMLHRVGLELFMRPGAEMDCPLQLRILQVKRTTPNRSVLRKCGFEPLQLYWLRSAVRCLHRPKIGTITYLPCASVACLKRVSLRHRIQTLRKITLNTPTASIKESSS